MENTKLSRGELFELMGIEHGDEVWCFHCGKKIKAADVLDNQQGDWCPTPDCDGGGWGIDLFGNKWWQ